VARDLSVADAQPARRADRSGLSGNEAPDHFYLITPSETAYYHFSTCGSDYDTMLYLYDVVDHEATTCLRSPAPHAGAADLIDEWDDSGQEICTNAGSRGNLEDVWSFQPLHAGETCVLQVTGYSDHGETFETNCDTDHARDAGAAGNYELTLGYGSEPNEGEGGCTTRDASPRKVCRKFYEEASSAKLALKHVQGLTCYCKRR